MSNVQKTVHDSKKVVDSPRAPKKDVCKPPSTVKQLACAQIAALQANSSRQCWI